MKIRMAAIRGCTRTTDIDALGLGRCHLTNGGCRISADIDPRVLALIWARADPEHRNWTPWGYVRPESLYPNGTAP
jgi:hypothetical protein